MTDPNPSRPDVATEAEPTGRRALVRRPSPRLADGIMAEQPAEPIDPDRAGQQWEAYVTALTGAGWSAVEVSPADHCPDSVFVEDTVVMLGPLAVLTRPGAPARQDEPTGTAQTLTELGYDVRPLGGGHLDGGDVLKVERTVYVGRSDRTDAAGVAALRRAAEPAGYRVVAVPVTKVLHLKSAVTALPDGSIIGYAPLVDDPSFWPHFRPMPEEGGSHVVDLGGGRLLMAASAPRSAELIADLGYEPVVVDITEYEKLDGCVTCLSVRLRSAPATG